MDGDVPALAPISSGPPVELPSPDRTRRIRIVGGVIAACTFVAVVVIALRGDDPTPLEASPTTTDGPTESSTAVERETTTTSEVRQPESPAPVRFERVVLAPELAAISKPTEVLMMSDDGIFHTLSLPSGELRSAPIAVDDSNFLGGQGFVVAPDAAAILTDNGMVVAPRDGPSTLAIDTSEFASSPIDVVDWTVGPDGATRFLVASYTSSGDTTLFEVGLDGSVEVLDDPVDISRTFSTFRSPDGRAYVNDAGGVYDIDAIGAASRIDAGVLRAVSDSSRLIRQCTPELDCGDVLIDQATGERRRLEPGVLPEELQTSGYGLDLAPDGSALSGIVDTADSQDLFIVDLTTGAQVTAQNRAGNRGTRWAADSSGVFDLALTGTGALFLDRASGQSVSFGAELGELVAIGVRLPDVELGPESVVATVPIEFSDGDAPSETALTVVALSRSGNLAEVDVDARTATLWAASDAIPIKNPTMFRLDDQIAIVSDEIDDAATSGYLSSPGQQRPLPAGLFGPGPILAGPISGTAWTSPPIADEGAAAGDGTGVDLVLVDLVLGVPVDPAQMVSIPAGVLLGGDGLGGLVVAKGGDIYVATATTTERLTTGELLAIGPDTAYVRECDDISTCQEIRLDRVDGTRSPIPPLLGLQGALSIDPTDPPFGVMGTAVAPGGDVAVVRTALNDDPAWIVVDVVNGPFVVLGELSNDAPIVWSEDGGSAGLLARSDLVVYDRRANTVVVVEGLGSVRAIAARSSGASLGGVQPSE